MKFTGKLIFSGLFLLLLGTFFSSAVTQASAYADLCNKFNIVDKSSTNSLHANVTLKSCVNGPHWNGHAWVIRSYIQLIPTGPLKLDLNMCTSDIDKRNSCKVTIRLQSSTGGAKEYTYDWRNLINSQVVYGPTLGASTHATYTTNVLFVGYTPFSYFTDGYLLSPNLTTSALVKTTKVQPVAYSRRSHLLY